MERDIANQPNLEQSFQDTFGQWQDEKDDEKIINEIYESRNTKIDDTCIYWFKGTLIESFIKRL